MRTSYRIRHSSKSLKNNLVRAMLCCQAFTSDASSRLRTICKITIKTSRFSLAFRLQKTGISSRICKDKQDYKVGQRYDKLGASGISTREPITFQKKYQPLFIFIFFQLPSGLFCQEYINITGKKEHVFSSLFLHENGHNILEVFVYNLKLSDPRDSLDNPNVTQ